MPHGERLVFGFMTGTSIDALDGSAVRVLSHGPDLRAEPLHHVSLSLGELAPRLRALASGVPCSACDIAALARDFALLHAAGAQELAARCGPPSVMVVHGQTVFHAPPLSWQLFNPAPLAAALNAPVIHDLRGADLAHGGQGAPITPLADWVLFRSASESRAVVNLGGFCNATMLPRGASPRDVLGFDVCACNHVLDEVARRALGAPFDLDGAAASTGRAQTGAVDELCTVLGAQREQRRSLGSGDESSQWVERWGGRGVSGPDLAATAVDAIARVIAGSIASHAPERVLLAGGGAHNRALVAALARHVPSCVEATDGHGVPIAHRESTAIAVLGALCEDQTPITLVQVTGTIAPALLSGCFTPRPRPE